jgi:type IV secretory pathway VirB10-like protein
MADRPRYPGLFHPARGPGADLGAAAAAQHVPSINQRAVRNFVAHAQTHNRIVECESMWDAKRAADRRPDGEPVRHAEGTCVDAFQESRAAEAARREAAKRQLGHQTWDATPAVPSAADRPAAGARDAASEARRRARDEPDRRSEKDTRKRRRRERSSSSSDSRSSDGGARRRRKEGKKASRSSDVGKLKRVDDAVDVSQKRTAREAHFRSAS